MALKFADTGTEVFENDGDLLELKKEPPGYAYDERMSMMGSMKMQVGDLDNAGASDIFADDRMVEVNVDKRKLTEFQLKTVAVALTVGTRRYGTPADIVGVYRKLDITSKTWVDSKVDEIWKRHEEAVKEAEADKDLGES